jgi:hypothetical protein
MLTSAVSNAQTAYSNEVKASATALYNSFTTVQQAAGTFTLTDTARTQWSNLPIGLKARVGISIGNMNNEQQKLVHRVLSATLSSQGYLKATGIMHLDDLLNQYHDSLYYHKTYSDSVYARIKSLKWSHRNFFFAFFGKPTETVWGFKLEGHHLSVNFICNNNQLSVTPFFIGTDPAEYPTTEYAGWRVLGQEQDYALALMNMLTPQQKAKAVKDTLVPPDIFTNPLSGKRLVENWGIKASELSVVQKELLELIVKEFVFNYDYKQAKLIWDKIVKDGFANVYFGWIGPVEEMKGHYFMINGPSFLIEFDDNGNPRDINNSRGNHIHSIFRLKGKDFGGDMLKQHYLNEKH